LAQQGKTLTTESDRKQAERELAQQGKTLDDVHDQERDG